MCIIPRMFHEFVNACMQYVEAWGYWGVVVFMAMESSIIPVPSEVVVPPAAIVASQEGASMSFWGVVLAGTVADLVNARIDPRLQLGGDA